MLPQFGHFTAVLLFNVLTQNHSSKSLFFLLRTFSYFLVSPEVSLTEPF